MGDVDCVSLQSECELSGVERHQSGPCGPSRDGLPEAADDRVAYEAQLIQGCGLGAGVDFARQCVEGVLRFASRA